MRVLKTKTINSADFSKVLLSLEETAYCNSIN